MSSQIAQLTSLDVHAPSERRAGLLWESLDGRATWVVAILDTDVSDMRE